jgi:hypothetical protein
VIRLRTSGRHSPLGISSLVLTIVGILGGCAVAAPPSVAPLPMVTTTVSESLRLTLTLDGPPLSGAVSWATLEIENVGDRAIRWAGGGCGDPGGIFVDLREVFPAGRGDWPEPLGRFKRLALGPGNANGVLTVGYIDESRWGTDLLCPASLRIETLAPHGRLSTRAGWDGTYEKAPVPTGPATVEAVFPVIGPEGEVADTDFDSHPVSVSARTAIEGTGGASVLAPALAVDAALGDPEFAAFVRAGPVARWLNPDLARIEGTWSVGLFKSDAAGVTESYAGVVVDGAGHVVGHR